MDGCEVKGLTLAQANQAVNLLGKINCSCPTLAAAKVQQRRRGDKRHRHEAGLLKSWGRKNL